ASLNRAEERVSPLPIAVIYANARCRRARGSICSSGGFFSLAAAASCAPSWRRSMADRAVLVEILARFVGLKGVQHPEPYPLSRPAVEARVTRVPFAEMRRQAAPGRAGAHDPEHGFDEET